MRVDRGEKETEDFSNTRPDVTKVIIDGLHPVPGRGTILPHSPQW
jgi:hypothetical protein